MTKKKVDKTTKTEPKHNMELIDFRKTPSILIKGQFGVRRIYSNKSGRFLILFEGENNTLVAGGAGENGKNLWLGMRPTEEPRQDYAVGMVDFARVFALALDGEYKVRRVWTSKKEKWYMIIENIANPEDSYMLGSSGEKGKNIWMMQISQAQKSSEATLSEVKM